MSSRACYSFYSSRTFSASVPCSFRLLSSLARLFFEFFVDKILTLSPLGLRVRETIRRDPVGWACSCGIHLRPYQRGVILAIKESILNHLGLTFVVIFPRQSGKNELQAHLFSWLLFRYAHSGGRIVSVSPTFKPQTANNMERVRSSLDKCVASRGRWHTSKGYMYTLGNACLQFFSGESHARVVGATADLLLSVDEAQEVDPVKFDKDFDPMTASTNATRVFWGTAWSSNTLLERQRRRAIQAQQCDGIQRLFFFTAEDVCRQAPRYASFLERVISELGRNHPLVRTQYYCETLDAQSGMFNASRLALIFGSQPTPSPFAVSANGDLPAVGFFPPSPLVGEGSGVGSDSPFPNPSLDLGRVGVGSDSPSPNPSLDLGRVGVGFLLDVAGMDESNTGLARWQPQAAQRHSADASLRSSSLNEGLGNPGRDSTTLTIVGIDLSTLETLHLPTYRVHARHAWKGENHLVVFGKLRSLVEQYSPQHIVIDATGVGEGLWALLDRAFPTRVIPVKFTAREKSEIGWRFLSIIETGRFVDPAPTDEVRLQYSCCISEILPGPGKHLRWGVPDGSRGPDGELIHDDYILADALTAILDNLEWTVSTTISIQEGFDPFKALRDNDYSSNRFYI
jgi:hypothetical protein